MAISVECQGCGAKYNLKQEFAGKNVKCPKCSTVIGVPGEAEQDHLIEENEPDGTLWAKLEDAPTFEADPADTGP